MNARTNEGVTASAAANGSALATYTAGRDARTREIIECEASAKRIAFLRAAVAIGGVALFAAIVWQRLGNVSWAVLALVTLTFVALVILHARVHARLERATACRTFHLRGLDRLEGRWQRHEPNGDRYDDEKHPYADDLDLFGRASLFQKMNTAATRFGADRFATWIKTSAPHEEILARQGAAQDLAPRVAFREAIAALGTLLDAAADPEPFLAWAESSRARVIGSPLRVAAYVLPFTTIALFLLNRAGVFPSRLWIASLVVQVFVIAAARPIVTPIVQAASSRERGLARYAEMITLIEDTPFTAPLLKDAQSRLAASGARATDEMARLGRIVGFVDARENEVFRLFIAPLLLWDVHCAVALDKWRARTGANVRTWFEAFADVEALATLASFAFENPDFSWPELTDGSHFEARALAHPLLSSTKRTANDVILAGAGSALVVTGSNMSGKSTLLRAIGANAVLALAGAPVCAASLRIGPLTVATSMRVRDSLEDGVSRFYAELKKLKAVLERAKAEHERESKADAHPVLFLLDEILHGTNSRERLIGARAIVRRLLDLGAIGAVSTHDLAIGDLEQEPGGHVKNVHFEEQVEGEMMTFDHKLRDGIVQSSNALRLMKMIGIDVID